MNISPAQFFLAIVVTAAFIGLGVSLYEAVLVYMDYRIVIEAKINGANQLMAHGIVRRKFNRVIMLAALCVQTSWRLFVGPAPIAMTILTGLTLVGVLVVDSVFDVRDRYILWWFIRNSHKDVQPIVAPKVPKDQAPLP